jgi:hypothetical protein
MKLSAVNLHVILYSLLPVIIPTPKHLLPTRQQRLEVLLADLEEQQFKLRVLQAELKGKAVQLETQIMEVEFLYGMELDELE